MIPREEQVARDAELRRLIDENERANAGTPWYVCPADQVWKGIEVRYALDSDNAEVAEFAVLLRFFDDQGEQTGEDEWFWPCLDECFTAREEAEAELERRKQS